MMEIKGYALGCNYWASHAGTSMWSDWRPDVVAADLDKLAAAGLDTLRVFPLWSDFQPLRLLRGAGGEAREIRLGEEAFTDAGPESDGVSSRMLERFAAFADLAEARGFGLIVGLVTGWMSGRLFAPEAFAGKDVLTDPGAIRAQVRFVRRFITELKEKKSIVAWDLGNECNCMGAPASRDAAWLWTASVAGAIKAADHVRPLISGMHSLRPEGVWDMRDQAELTDILTTHPYPHWTPWADQDRVDSIRTMLHATAESRLYADIGGAPCLVEETGTMGPMVSDEASAARFLRANLVSNWSHGQTGLLWWCAHDQTELAHAPYDWNACERELGLLRTDGSPKEFTAEFAAFRRFLRPLGDRRLPPHRTDAICILTPDQDAWKVAFAAFVLAKQAGFDLSFRWHDQSLPEATAYLMPSIVGHLGMPRRRIMKLLDRIRAGAALLVSGDGGFFSGFEEVFGVRPIARTRAEHGIRLAIRPTAASTLMAREDGEPLLTRAAYGAGTAYFLNQPIERIAGETPGAFEAFGFDRLYRAWAEDAGILAARAVRKTHSDLGVTEHPAAAGSGKPERVFIVLTNYSAAPIEDDILPADGYRLAADFHDTVRSNAAGVLRVALEPAASAVLELRRGD